jgi:eukaryotic-like serine/threonine-protein kinase
LFRRTEEKGAGKVIGKTLGHYRVVQELGRGGMGEVYLAEDISLDRKVALKFLPDAFTGDPERMARFEREAKLLASLNHPNIAAVYGLEQMEGKRFIAMELVEGESLAQRLSKGALSVEDTLGVCRQIAEGLEAAHEKGVIHRDLKPANVMITAGDKVKILDFGLAKALSDETQSVDSSQSPTLTEAMTRTGVILGTAAYMSPEQAKGKTVDKRADIWAFGCILYECLTGKRVFEGETVTETLAAILKGEPNWNSLPGTIPASIRILLQRCLQRDPSRRIRDAADARIEIEEEMLAPPSRTSIGSVTQTRLPWIAAALCLIVALTLAIIHFGRTQASAPSVKFTISPPKDAAFVGAANAPRMAISPDGRFLAFTASVGGKTDQIWIRRFDALEPKELSGTDRAESPFWSPDSRFIGFFADGKLKITEVSGGPVQTLCAAPTTNAGGTWNRDGVIVFGGLGSPLQRVSSEGGVPVGVTALDRARSERAHQWPQFLPDSRHFLYLSLTEKTEDRAIYLGSLDSGETALLTKSVSMATFSPSGHLLYLLEHALVAQPFDAKRLRLTGDAKPIAESVILAANGRAAFSISETGILAYRAGASALSQLAWFNREGKQIGTIGDPAAYSSIELSPDRKRASVCVTNQASDDIWLQDLTRPSKMRFTFNAAAFNSIWSPDARTLAFNSGRKGTLNLYRNTSTGAGSESVLIEDSYAKNPNSWSPDGKFILYGANNPMTGNDLFVLRLNGNAKPFPFLNTSFNESMGQFSPDGRWVAYVSNETGKAQVYVAPFPGPGGKWLISTTDTGIAPRWRSDGSEIFYVDWPNRKLMAASVNAKGSVFEVGTVTGLFEVRATQGPYPWYSGYPYDVSADGQQFLIVTTPDLVETPITVVLNWTSLLKK